MAYIHDRAESERIRKRIKQILHEKIKDPEYKGRGYSGGARTAKPKNPNRVAASKKSAKKNPWLKFYKDYVKKHGKKGMSGAELSKAASKAYKKKSKKRSKK